MRQNFKNTKTFLRLMKYIWRYKLYFCLGVFGTLLASAIAAGFSWFLRPLLNKGFISPDIHFIHWIPAIVIGAYLLLGLSAFIGDTFMALVARNVVMVLQRRVFDRFLSLPVTFFDEHSRGQLLAIIIYNIEQVTNTCTSVLMTILSDGFYIIGLVVVMFVNSWLLALIFFVTMPIILIVFFVVSRCMKRLSLKIQDSVAEATHIAEESLEGIKMIRVFDGARYESNKFARVTKTILKKQVRLVMINSLGVSGVRLIASFALALTIYIATVPHSGLSTGAFMSIIAAMLSAFKPLRKLTQVNGDLQKGIAGAESVFSILDEPVEKNTGSIQLNQISGDIKFQDVNFHYSTRHQFVLSDINIKINSGQTVALVGHSGSGKSTLMSLLQRDYLPDSGQILLGQINIREIELSSLRAQFAVVSEHVSLVNDSLAHNIAYGRLSAFNMKEIEKAAKEANLWSWIQTLPHGLDTAIGENGLLLSAGQRQRVAIARAILKNAPILILDEATSGLDLYSENQIYKSLASLMKNRTTIIIAHRLTSVEHADMIFVFHEGKIVEQGQYHDLIDRQGYFSKLYECLCFEV